MEGDTADLIVLAPIITEQIDIELVVDRVDTLGRLSVLDGCATLGEALDRAAQRDDPAIARNGDLDWVRDSRIEGDTRLNVVCQLSFSGQGVLLSQLDTPLYRRTLPEG